MDSLARRQLLLSAIGGALIANASSSDSFAQSPTGSQTSVKPLALPESASLSAEDEMKAFAIAKERITLAANWPRAFDTSFEKGAIVALERISAEEAVSLTHNARLVEPLLGEIATLLDRCLASRNEGADLEISGIAAAASRAVADIVRDIDQDLAASDATRDAADVLFTEYMKTAAVFGSTPDPIARGYASQVSSDAAANLVLRTSSERRSQLSVSRLRFTQELDRQLMGRFDVPGNAHNFVQRYERLRQLFNSDLTAAFRRAHAVQKGLQFIFKYYSTLPTPSAPTFLDDFVIWTREAMRWITKIAEREIEFEASYHVATADAGPHTMTLPEGFGLEHVRLKSISANYMMASGTGVTDSNSLATVRVALAKDATEIGPPVVVLFPTVHYVTRPPSVVDSPLLINVLPYGSWSIRMNKNGIHGTGNENWARTIVEGVMFRFRCVATANPQLTLKWWTDQERL